MKNLLLNLFVCCAVLKVFPQLGIGTINPHSSSILDIQSTQKGFLPPVLTLSQMFEIENPAEGLMLFNSDEGCICYFTGSNWINLCTQTILFDWLDYSNVIGNRINANNAESGDQFGYSVSISGDGNILVAGSPRESSDSTGNDNNNTSNSGAVYVYRYNGFSWDNGVRLKAHNTGPGDQFGFSVSISGDGNTIVVGAKNEDWDGLGNDNNNISDGGAAYVYRYDGSSWDNGVRIKANNVGVEDYFGYSVSINYDGNTLVVGAKNEDWNGIGNDNDNATNSGAVYVYRYVGSSWGNGVRLKANNIGDHDQFGNSVSISEDGNTLVVGAPTEASDGTGNDNNNISNSGAAYVYRYDGSAWDNGLRIKANNVGSYDFFGLSVAVSGDGNTLVVGAPSESSDGSGNDNQNNMESGAVYVYRYNGSWDNGLRLKAHDVDDYDGFGWSVALNKDGSALVVGAIYEYFSGSGNKAYVYRYDGSNWNSGVSLNANNVGGDDYFGRSASISENGNSLVIGTPLASSGGAVYIFK